MSEVIPFIGAGRTPPSDPFPAARAEFLRLLYERFASMPAREIERELWKLSAEIGQAVALASAWR